MSFILNYTDTPYDIDIVKQYGVTMEISRIGLLTRKYGLSSQEFHDRWKSVHGDMVQRLPGLKRYYQHHVIDDTQLGIDHVRGGWRVDGFSEIVFDSREAMDEAFASAAFVRTASDIGNYAESIQLVVCRKNKVIPFDEGTDKPFVKRMSILTRHKDIDENRFVDEWTGKHARDVPSLPHIMGYTQNIVVDRYRNMTEQATRRDVPVDGIVELWFPSAEAIVEAFSSPQAEITQGHAKAFLDTITTFLVQSRRLL